MEQFPLMRPRCIPVGKSYKKSVIENIYCTCRIPNDPTIAMICCDECGKWYHKRCEGIGLNVSMKNKIRHCTTCKQLSPIPSCMSSIIPNLYIAFVLGCIQVLCSIFVLQMCTQFVLGCFDIVHKLYISIVNMCLYHHNLTLLRSVIVHQHAIAYDVFHQILHALKQSNMPCRS